MTILRHVFGWHVLTLAEALAALAHRLYHVGAWCTDIDMEEECAQCRAHEENNNDPTDGPWAI